MTMGKSIFRFSPRLLGLFVAINAIVTLSSIGEDAPTDPIVGRWRWHNNAAIIFHADGTAGLSAQGGPGVWKCVSPNQDPRKYILDWGRGMWVETLYLKKHANRISGRDQFGDHVWGIHIQD